jgi:hypothetical protein
MAYPSLSRPRSRNQKAQVPQPNDPGPMREAQAHLTRKLRERDLVMILKAGQDHTQRVLGSMA